MFKSKGGVILTALMTKPKLLVFASGTKDGGGSGFENLVLSEDLDAEIVGVVSNHESGGVRRRAELLGIPFVHFNPTEHSNILKNVGMSESASGNNSYKKVVEESGAEWVALSGWFKFVSGLDPAKIINIHPALLSQLGGPSPRRSGLRPREGGRFGGEGMYGRHIHEAVKAVIDSGEIKESGFTMHFVTDDIDRGPAFFEFRVPISVGTPADEIARMVNNAEHEWQPKITNMVVHQEIKWDGKDPKSMVVPRGYGHLPKS